MINDLQVTIKIMQLLHDHGCLYNEVDEYLDNIKQHCKEIREQKEYDTALDFINGYKTRNVGNQVVDALPDITIRI